MGIKTLTRKLIEVAVAHFGYDLRIAGTPPCGYSRFLDRVAQSVARPRTVFDIGVGNGTPWLYAAFPGAHFVLIEPQPEFEMRIQRICGQIDAEYHQVGVGSSEQHLPIYQLPGSPTGSSFLKPNEFTTQRWGESEKSNTLLHVVPLDTYRELPGPFFVKIDTEGFELEVLRGARQVLEKTGFVLMEIAITPRQLGEPDLMEIGVFMKECGFCLVDFPMMVQQTVGGPLLYVDAAFARIDFDTIQSSGART